MTPSNLIRTPAQVAQMMRYTAVRTAMLPGLAPSLFGTMLVTWAEILEGAPRAPLPEVAADGFDLATEIETTADAIAAECACAGGRFVLEAADTPGFIAWLREAARQAATLAHRARAEPRRKPARLAGDLDLAPAAHPDDVAPPGAELGGEASLRRKSGLRPDDIVPGLTTGAGDPVTIDFLRHLAARRAQRHTALPCDVEERP